MDVTILKWLAVLWPAALVGLFEYLRHTPFVLARVPMAASNWLTALLVLAATAAVSRAIFTLLERAQADLQRKQQQLAVMEERDRIARELHDGISQALFYANVKLAEAERHLKAGALEAAARALTEGREAIRFSHDDVRQAIFNLKVADSATRGLEQALRAHVEEFRRQTGIEVALDIESLSRFRLPPRTEGEALRIIQEALWNVRKHARANRVDITCRPASHRYLRFAVADDGCGLPPGATGADGGGFGLKIMRQRAQAVGGRVEIRSAPGQGTCVELLVPVTTEGECSGDGKAADR